MEILIAEDMGFCFGVKRAIRIARDTRKKTESNVYTLGSIIHNPQVVNQLKEEGIEPVSSLDEIESGYVVIRSHGIHPELKSEIIRRGFNLVDATCPLVKRAQEKARELVEEGYETFIIGEKEHPEVKGIVGRTQGRIKVINYKSEINIKRGARVGIIAQTTQSMEALKNTINRILPLVKELKIYNTICEVTDRRQEEAKRLAAKSDIIIVIGGKKSANTSRLAAMAAEEGCETHHIETYHELNEDWFTNKKVTGVIAGASTPDWIINEVINKLKEISKKREEILHER